MKISAINNNYYKNSFKQSSVMLNLGAISGIDNKVDEFVKNRFENEKQTKLKMLTSAVYNKFTKKYNKEIEKAEKFKNPYNKAFVLNSMAHLSYQNGDTEKAAILLAQSFNLLDGKAQSDQNRIKKLVESSENINIMEDFFYFSNNAKAKYFVMKSLNNLNNPYYLPIAEAVCDTDSDSVTYNSKQTVYEARQFLNKHYDLNQLTSYFDENDNYKIGAMNLLSKWGLEKHQKIAQTLFNDENEYVKIKAKQAELSLKRASKFFEDNDNLQESHSQLPEKRDKIDKTSLLNLIESNQNNTLDIKYIKQLGQIGTTYNDARYVRPSSDSSYSKSETVKAEAFLKIMIRSNLIKSYLG